MGCCSTADKAVEVTLNLNLKKPPKAYCSLGLIHHVKWNGISLCWKLHGVNPALIWHHFVLSRPVQSLLYMAFHDMVSAGLDPDDFVEEMKRKGIRVPGIGHRIKSKVMPRSSCPHKVACRAQDAVLINMSTPDV